VTNADLEELLKGLPRLQVLDLSSTGVTDTGLMQLEGLAELQRLDLSSTRITDTGLQCLKGLTSLRELNLKQTQVTATAVWKLQRALPKCRIEVTDGALSRLQKDFPNSPINP
jgi:Leucine-rich repeat (LRR) protein